MRMKNVILILVMVGWSILALSGVSEAGVSCTINLQNGTHNCAGKPGVTVVALANKKALVKLDMSKYTEACFKIKYKNPSGWTVNIGDVIQNDGHGGGSGANPLSVAEMQIVGNRLSVFSSAFGPGKVDKILDHPKLNLKGKTIKVCVKDQFLSIDAPKFSTILQTPNFATLYSLGTKSNAGAGTLGAPKPSGGDNNGLFAAFNRVITGRGDRVGAGVMKVSISLN